MPARPGFVKVARRDELPPGSGKLVLAHGKPIALFNVNGEFYAVNYICPHLGGPRLRVGGTLTGTVVTCPWHACLPQAGLDVRRPHRPARPSWRALGLSLRSQSRRR